MEGDLVNGRCASAGVVTGAEVVNVGSFKNAPTKRNYRVIKAS